MSDPDAISAASNVDQVSSLNSSECISCCCGSHSKATDSVSGSSPDFDFHADSFIKLTYGITAYRLIDPRDATVAEHKIPLIVCLHGMSNSSYMWSDVADLLTDFEQGPQARVLVFDFYGRGRSPWTGVNITLDILVTQTKELLDYLKLSKNPAAFIGYDMGGAVAAGFAAKYPALCKSLSLLSPIGIKYKPLVQEKLLNRKYIGEILMFRQRNTLHEAQECEFHDKDEASNHRYLLDKQIGMITWQIRHTPGYLGALLSTYRYFPLRGMEELYTAIGRHPRKALVIWGDHDNICNYRKCIKLMEESFPNGIIVDVLDCGHNLVAEKFEDVMKELLSFNKDVFDGIEHSV